MSLGLLLSGGGARAAYQAGVLRHIQELSVGGRKEVPFPVLVGVSAGAINMSALATHADDFARACDVMTKQWDEVRTERVFRTKPFSFLFNAFRWFVDLSLGGAFKRYRPRARSLVDTTPLAELLSEILPPGKIQEHLEAGILKAVAVSATDYATGALTFFVEAPGNRTLWKRHKRFAVYDRITPAHVLASCALPIVFPAVKLHQRYYGDGSIRNTAPLSPCIHLGSRKILVIGVRCEHQSPAADLPRVLSSDAHYPSLAQVSGTLLNSVFFDALEEDREQMSRINRLLDRVAQWREREQLGKAPMPFRRIRFLYVGPSRDLGAMAVEHRDRMPRLVRYFLRGLGSEGTGASDFLSYLLFESSYTQEIMKLGYEDARARSDEIRDFIFDADDNAPES